MSTEQVELHIELDHYCPCGAISPAWVTGHSKGASERTLLDRIESDREDEAQRDAALLARLARCPACHKRDYKALRDVCVRYAVPYLFIVAFAIVLAITDKNARSMPIVFAIAASAFSLAKIHRLIRHSDTRVKYIRPSITEPQGPYRSST